MEKKITFLGAIRDLIIAYLPINILPLWLIKFFYGFNPDFIFLAHPRNMTDMYEMIPFLKIWKLFLPERLIQQFASLWPAGVVTDVKWNKKVQGLIVAVPTLPQTLFAKRERTMIAIEKVVNFIRKISRGNVYIGLAAWWPMATNNGLAFKRVLKENDRVVATNGHTATLMSIYFTIKKICKLIDRDLSSIKIAIIGIGKMGSAIAEIFNGKVACLGLFDKNNIRLNFLENKIKANKLHAEIKKHYVSKEQFDKENISDLQEYNIAICTTSNIEYIIKDKYMLENIVVLDDSRPEAFPRIIDISRKVMVLEGGLVKLDGIRMGADFGFSKESNVFGCMAEAIILALDKEETVKPILGDIDFDNLRKMSEFCNKNGITEGDLKSGHQKIDSSMLRKIMA